LTFQNIINKCLVGAMMVIKTNLDSYSISQPAEGICKQSAVWGQSGNSTYPLIYLQRPKWIKSDEKWKEIVDSVKLELPKGFEI